MKNLIIAILFLLPITLSAQLLRSYGVVEIGSTFPASSSTGAKYAYRPVDSSFYRWVSGSTWVKVVSPSILPLYLKQVSGTTSKFSGDTINLVPYLLKTDTTSMLLSYVNLAGWGLSKLSKTLLVDSSKVASRFYVQNIFLAKTDTAAMLAKYIERGDTTSAFASYLKRPVGWGLSLLTGKYPFVDSSKVASRYYVSTSPTTIAANYIATSNGTNLVARNLFDNNTYVGILNSKPFQLGQWTTAARPTGVNGYAGFNTSFSWPEWYSSSGWFSPLQSSLMGGIGTATRLLFNDANGRAVDNANLTLNTSSFRFGVGNSLASVNAEMYLGNTTSNAIISSGAGFIINLDATNFYSDITSFTIRKNSFGAGGTTLFTVTEAGNAAFGSSSITNAQLTINGSTSAVSLLGKALDIAPTMVATANNDVLVGMEVNPSFNIGAFTGTRRFAARFGQSLAAVNTEISLGNAASNAILSSGAGFTINLDATAAYADATSFNINKNAFGTSGTTIFQVAETGNVTIGGSGTTYILGTSSTNAYGLPRGTVAQRPTIVASTTPVRYNTDSTALEYGESVGTWRQIATRAYARSLVSGLPTTWLKTELEAARDVNINGGSTTDFRIQNTRVQFDSKFKIGSDSSFSHDPATNTTLIDGAINITNSSYFGLNATGTFAPSINFNNSVQANASVYLGYNLTSDFGSYTNSKGFAWGIAPYSDKINYQWSWLTRWDSVGTDGWSSDLIYGANFTKSSHYFRGGGTSIRGGEFNFLTRAAVGNVAFRVYNASVDYLSVLTGGATIVKNRVTGAIFLITDPVGDSTLMDGTLRFKKYGTPATTAATLGKTESGYVTSFATDGTVTSYKLARDTFIEDVTLFSVGTLMNDCQELTIVSSMTVLAPSNQEIRFPDASDLLRGKKIIVYSKKKDSGAFIPQIKVVGGVFRLYFTTNPAVGGTDPSDQSTLSIDDSTWSDHGTTFEFTCLKIDNTPSYRWVLKQR